MIFSTLKINKNEPIYIQLENHILNGIENGTINKNSKLPSTREVSKFLKISRNSVISAYEELESKGIIVTKRGIGSFIIVECEKNNIEFNIDYQSKINNYANSLRNLDIIKTELPSKKNMISFKSIAPESDLFNIDDFKRSLLDAWNYENVNLLNYGYAKGYKPLLDYLSQYMIEKRVDMDNKDILITNGFTEAFDIIISSMTQCGDVIICEEPTHNTALKIMKSYGLEIIQIKMDNEGINLELLEDALKNRNPKFGYLIPSYNNPTGIVTKTERRNEIYKLFMKYEVPIIEDGFNEELLYTSSPIDPIASLCGKGNGVIYVGSLSKILFPGLRIGWITADSKLIDIFESVKRGRTINSSFLDQSTLYYYLKSGAFNRYLKTVRKYYKDKFTLVMSMINKYIPYEYVTGEGGLHVFIKLKYNIDSHELLKLCYEDGVTFMPGDIFYNGKTGLDTFRIGFGRVSDEDIEKGVKIIGKNVEKLISPKTP